MWLKASGTSQLDLVMTVVGEVVEAQILFFRAATISQFIDQLPNIKTINYFDN